MKFSLGYSGGLKPNMKVNEATKKVHTRNIFLNQLKMMYDEDE